MSFVSGTVLVASGEASNRPLSPAISDNLITSLSDKESSASSIDHSSHPNHPPKMSGALVSNMTNSELFEEKDNVTAMSTRILEIIFDYALNKFDDCRDRLEVGRPKFIEVLNAFVKAGARIDMALPAFPFKSANKVYKALGFLPDKAEEIALERLHNMCKRIAEVYKPGAKVVIISDGLVYNDLLSISDRHTWLYGEALRMMAVEKGFSNIDFSRLRDFVPLDSDFKLPETLDEISYVANATNFRRFILNNFGKDDLDIDQVIATEEDTRLTYQGYRRFLMSDLRHIYTLGADRTSNAYKKQTKYLAKQMLARGYAYAGAIKRNFPHHLRLSIHQSTGEHKVSMSLLDTKTGFTTPWHCSVALMTSGEWMSAPMGDFKENPRMKIVEENGRPSYFRELTEKEFLEDQKRAEEEAKLLVKDAAATVLQRTERNENFVHWEDLTYNVKHGSKTTRLLDQMNGWLRGGTITALMGVSGAGQTVLLELLANRPNVGVVHGEVYVNGLSQNMVSKHSTGTVHQQDLEFSTATVKEALIFSALLRQPKTITCVDKIAYAEEVLGLIGMEALADTVIGNCGENLNGEQRKRLSIGVELAAKPTLALFLDQPLAGNLSSTDATYDLLTPIGLDSQAAFSICQLLRKIAGIGLAILCIVNQPSARLLQKFDRLLLLGKGGKQLYFGKIGPSCKTMVSYFERNGVRPCDAEENPAEWMLDVTSSTQDFTSTIDSAEVWQNSAERRAVKKKLASLRQIFSARANVIDGSDLPDETSQSMPKFDAIALQRAFHRYCYLENMQLPIAAPTDSFPSWLTNEAPMHRPAYLS